MFFLSNKKRKKKMPNQTKTLTTKPKQTKKHGIHFVFANYLWAWGSALECVWYTFDTQLERIDFSLSQQLSVANNFFIRGGTLYPLLLLCAEIVSRWTCTGREHAVTISMSSYVPQPRLAKKWFYLEWSTISRLLQSFCVGLNRSLS